MAQNARTEEYLRHKTAEVAAMAGKRGVTDARAHLESLQVAHYRIAGQLDATRLYQRPTWQITRTRQEIAELATYAPTRGEYGQISRIPCVPDRLRRHPALHTVAELAANLATAKSILPAEYQEWDDKRRGEGLSVDLYGYTDAGSMSVWQIRRVSRRSRNAYLDVTKEYTLVTIGEDGPVAREVPPHRIKRSVAVDPAPDAPIRALNGDLKLPAPITPPWTAYKVVALTPEGRMLSLYDGETEYVVGKRMAQAARHHHNGGYYVSRTPEDALAHAEQVNCSHATADLPRVLLTCQAIGRGIQYDGGKVAVGVLTPTSAELVP